jgi:hypothetical protein
MSDTDQVVSVSEAAPSDTPMRECRICKVIQPLENFKRASSNGHGPRCHTCIDKRKFTTKVKSPRINDVDYKAVAEGVKRTRIAPAKMAKYIPSQKENGHKPKATLNIALAQNDMLKKAFLNAYELFAGIGVSEADMSTIFGITNNVITRVKFEEEGSEAWNDAMKRLQTKLASQVLVHGLGFDYEESKSVFEAIHNEDGEVTYIEKKKEVWKRHYNGDPGLLEFYMVNRFPGLWKKSTELITRKAEGYDVDPADRTRKQIESLARDVLSQHTENSQGEYRVPVDATLISGDSGQAGEK